MRNMVRILAAGALVGWLSGGLAYADDAPVATFKAKALQKVVAPGGTIKVEVSLENVTDLGAFQLMMKSTGGERGTLTVEEIVINKEREDFVFALGSSMEAIDPQQMRAAGVLMEGGRSFDRASVATVTMRASSDAAGTFQVNLDKGQETFLRDSNAGGIALAIGKAVTITVSDRATPTRAKRRKTR